MANKTRWTKSRRLIDVRGFYRGLDAIGTANTVGLSVRKVPRPVVSGGRCGEGLPPGVEHGGDAEIAPEVAGIAAKPGERGGGGMEEQAVDQTRVALGK